MEKKKAAKNTRWKGNFTKTEEKDESKTANAPRFPLENHTELEKKSVKLYGGGKVGRISKQGKKRTEPVKRKKTGSGPGTHKKGEIVISPRQREEGRKNKAGPTT